jgi:benzoyl-CoA reductase/2-hydroxyglutaryl-CoA dehydratase subunit BcrC/BadD/HgdB
MTMDQTPYVGFTCAYTPLALIDAAGCAPFRILPMGDSPDRAGQVLHDNLCPHVKRVLDRALDNDLPELAGVVLLNSCDAMRRLADAWPRARPNDRLIFVDLPFTSDEAAVSYFSAELSRLANTLFAWNGRSFSQEALAEGVKRYNRMALLFDGLRQRLRDGTIDGGAARVQGLYNAAVTKSFSETLSILDDLEGDPAVPGAAQTGVPVYVFGNVLPDPEAFSLFDACGVRIVAEDFCTGSRIFSPIEVVDSTDLLTQVARSTLERPRCARTIHPTRPGMLAEEVLASATACKAIRISRGCQVCAMHCERPGSLSCTLREIAPCGLSGNNEPVSKPLPKCYPEAHRQWSLLPRAFPDRSTKRWHHDNTS